VIKDEFFPPKVNRVIPKKRFCLAESRKLTWAHPQSPEETHLWASRPCSE
jgi:hypothetical protein